jgi:hypothetical protein
VSEEYGYGEDALPYIAGGLPQQGMSSDLIRWQLSGEQVLDEIEHNLKGEIWVVDAEGRGSFVTRYKALLNDNGVNAMMAGIRHVLNANIYLSDLEEEDIRNLTLSSTIDAIFKLRQMYKEWGVDVANLSTIVNIIEFQTYAALRRAYKGATMHFLITTQRVIEQRVDRPQMERSQNIPSFSFFNLLGKKRS